MINHDYDDTRGIVIGDVLKKCKIFYDNREQHTFYAKTDNEAKQLAESYIRSKRLEDGKVFSIIYPGEYWELRIY